MAEVHEIGTLANSQYMGRGRTFSDIGKNRYQLSDEHTLARLGKKQVLKVYLDPSTHDFSRTAG